ncbi:MAG: hybrid sensor histidine kinase/response regulator [Acidobacteriota bacterium]|nr:hybrid sensor histidine kinase/response regulator [Acidobacteriota bacterium]
MSLFSTKKLREVQERERKETSAKKHTIMIVDDETPNLRILSTMLSSKYHIVEAGDGQDALEKIREGNHRGEISLVISDQRMPNMTGTELFKELITELPHAKRIILTGYTDMDVILDTINECQIFKFILKPFDQHDLSLTVSRALEAFELEARLEAHRKELEQKVEERTRELLLQEKLASLGRLTAGLAHELRNPLNFVKPMAESLPGTWDELNEKMKSAGFYSPETGELMAEIRNGLNVIQKYSRRADAIVDSMVRLSNDSTGTREEVNIHRLLENHAGLALHGIQAKDESFTAEVIKEFDETAGRLGGVEQNLSRLFLNLLNNAVEALYEKWSGDKTFKPVITITTRRPDPETTVIVIRDNGPGIQARVRDQILEPFVTTKSPDKGSIGLGLFICYEIVKDHQGKIEHRTEEGEFTEVVLTLPG